MRDGVKRNLAMMPRWDQRRLASAKRALYLGAAMLLAAAVIGCTPTADQMSQANANQQWAAYFRQVRQECSEHVSGSCPRFQRALAAQEAYALYYSTTVPGLASPMFVPAVVTAVNVHLPSMGGGFR
jgi:hypothetical protein